MSNDNPKQLTVKEVEGVTTFRDGDVWMSSTESVKLSEVR